MPGAKYLSENEHVIKILQKFDEGKKLIAAICASPALVLPKAKISNGRKVTSYPGMEQHLKDAIYLEEPVVQDGNLITSRGPATALEFSYKILEALGGNSDSIKNGMLYHK